MIRSVTQARWLGLGFILGCVLQVGLASAEPSKPVGKAAAPLPVKPAAPPAKKLGPPPDKQTSAKANAYIELMNAESNDLFSMRESMFQAIDPKIGPTCKESLELQREIGPNGGKYDAYRKRIKAKPALKPDAAALKMVDAVEGLWKLGSEPGAHSRLQAKTPDEWCKRIKEVFPRYVALFEQYAEGNREVSAYIDAFTEDRDLREVDATSKKYGKHYRYQFARLTLEGKLMMRTVRAELNKDAPNLAALRERFAAYLAIADETSAMMAKEPKSRSDPYPNSFSFFLGESMPKLKRASEELVALLGEKPGKDFAARLDRKWGGLVEAYNEIIRYGNNMAWSPKQK